MNRRIEVLQTSALPLGYRAITVQNATYYGGAETDRKEI